MQIKLLKEKVTKLQQKSEASEKRYKDLVERFHAKWTECNEEILHLRNHNKKLLTQVRKCKTKKHKLEQEKEGFDKKFNEILSKKEEENLRFKSLN